MIDVAIQAVPNQDFSIQLGEDRYDFTIKEANGCMVASVTRDNVPLVSNVRLVAGSPVLPYRYQERGNFVLTTPADELPYYLQFGVTQFLVFLDAAELAALREENGTA
jgi:hypothetical protein